MGMAWGFPHSALSAFSHQLSAISFQPSAFSHQLSAISFQLFVFAESETRRA
jgi:hypothetical protein